MENNIKEKNREPNLIVFARQSFSSIQKDIFTLAVSQLETGLNVQPDLFHNKTVTVTARMLEEVTGKNYQRLRTECKDLSQKVIEISNDEKEEFEFIVPFPRIKYRKGVVELTMFADVAQWFLELKRGFAEYYIRESLSLEHFNKKRLYELLCSYKKRDIPIWKVYDNELKYCLGLEKEEYKGRPKEFSTKIIAVCINAINDKTSIHATYTRDKDLNGWFTVFEVKEKKPKELKATAAVMPTDEKSQRLVEALKKLNVRQDMIYKIVTEHQTECWPWLNKNRDAIASGYFRNPAGVLLLHLGLVKPKIQNQANGKEKNL
jgi:plasmid replication initiation protein